MNVDHYMKQFFFLKDAFIKDARTHAVTISNILDWMRDHLDEDEYNDTSDLGFTSREEELAWTKKALPVLRKSETVMGYVALCKRAGELSAVDRYNFVHAIGDALDPENDRERTQLIREAMLAY